MIWKDEGCVLRACAVRSARCLAVVAVVSILAKQTGWLGLVGVVRYVLVQLCVM